MKRLTFLFVGCLFLMSYGCGSSGSSGASGTGSTSASIQRYHKKGGGGGGGGGGTTTTPQKMGGVYALGQSFSSSQLSDPNITGISLRIGWNAIETKKGVYDWSYLDNNISAAAANGKKVMIRVFGGQFTPDWVYAEGAQSFNFTDPDLGASTMPVPWDSVFLNEWTSFIKALGTKYAGMAQVVTIQMTGPSRAGEMYLPNKTDQAFWTSLGYTDTKLIGAWSTVIDAYNAAFPSTALGIDIAYPISFGDKESLLTQILDYAYNRLGTRLRVQGNWLAAKTNSTNPLYLIVKNFSSQTDVGFQMLCSANDPTRLGGTLRQAIDNGLAAGASYIEFWGVDAVPANDADLQYANENLKLNEHFSVAR